MHTKRHLKFPAEVYSLHCCVWVQEKPENILCRVLCVHMRKITLKYLTDDSVLLYYNLQLLQTILIEAYFFWEKRKWVKVIYRARLRVRWCLYRTKVVTSAVFFLIYCSFFIYYSRNVNTGSVAQPLSNSMGTGVQGHFPRLKRPELEIVHSTASNAKFKNKWTYTPLPPYAFIV